MNEVPSIAWIGRPDRQSLEGIERFLRSQECIVEVEFRPDRYEPQSIRAVLDIDASSESDVLDELIVFWYTSGDFSVQYREVDPEGDSKQYLWFRDPNSNKIRCQCRQSCGPTTRDLVFDSCHPIDILTKILAVIEQS